MISNSRIDSLGMCSSCIPVELDTAVLNEEKERQFQRLDHQRRHTCTGKESEAQRNISIVHAEMKELWDKLIDLPVEQQELVKNLVNTLWEQVSEVPKGYKPSSIAEEPIKPPLQFVAADSYVSEYNTM